MREFSAFEARTKLSEAARIRAPAKKLGRGAFEWQEWKRYRISAA